MSGKWEENRLQSHVNGKIPFGSSPLCTCVCTVCISIDDVKRSPILVTSGDKGKLINFLFIHLLLFVLF